MPRAFVVGNGPSLAQTDLDKLIGEVAFAVNNVHLAYQFTDWRPTHYVRAEQAHGLEPEHWMESMLVHLGLGCEIWCNPWFVKPRHNLPIHDKVHSIKSCAHYGLNFHDPRCPHLWHLPILCTFGSTVNVAVQIAAMQGYNPIYLIGCDLGYQDGKPSHFSSDYENGSEQPARYANLNALAAHMIAARTGQVKIYNATIGGDLEVYERADFNSLFD